MGQQRDAVNADPAFKQWVATLSGRPPPFQCRSDDAGGRKIFCLGSPRSITPFIEKGGGGVLQHQTQIPHRHTDPLIFPTDGLAKTYQHGTEQGTLVQYDHQDSQCVCRQMRCSFATHVN